MLVGIRDPRRPVALVALLALLACDSGFPPPRAEAPAAPAQNDPSIVVDQVRAWYLIPNDVTPGHDQLLVRVQPGDDHLDFVDVWLGDRPGVRLERYPEDFRQVLDLSGLPPGEHQLLLAADGADTAFARLTFYRSHPLYVLVSNDWDTADNSELALGLQEQLHQQHPGLRMTHFVGPYTFTDPDIAPERVTRMVEWVTQMRDQHGDEIGLHIHPYCSFVEHAGLDCLHEPSTVYAEGDPTGYTVMCAAYSEQEFTTLLLAADALFEEHGLGKPTSFRAGGWTADLSTLAALENAGYVADTSANNWARMEEWEGVQNGVLYEWNKTNWATIGDTSQPYYPSLDDILSDDAPTLAILQVPDNGSLVDYVSGAEMIEIFQANWDGGPLAAPVAYSIGYHPTNFNHQYKRRMDEALNHVGDFLASNDRGPVVYGTLSEMPRVWKRNQ